MNAIEEDLLSESTVDAHVALNPVETYFAPPGRDTEDELRRRHAIIESTHMLKATIDAMPALVAILNPSRQVVSANRALLDLIGVKMADVLGKRLGEIVGCVQPPKGPDGCGTAPGCITCGAVDAILQSQRSLDRCTRECRVVLENNANGLAMDLRVTATAMDIGNERFTLCTIEDIQDQKRLKVLNRVFFHDVLNTAGGIRGFSQFLADEVQPHWPHRSFLVDLCRLADQLIDEIQCQRDLMSAEAGDLEVVREPVNLADLLAALKSLYARHEVSKDRSIKVESRCQGQLLSDRRLLLRVLGNLLKNALEATAPSGSVAIRCQEHDGNVVFEVHNDSVMSEEVQLQIFQRSFSTKGQPGRGIGTYSIKLLTERYLGGQVAFRSAPPEGTVFTVSIPQTKRAAGYPTAL